MNTLEGGHSFSRCPRGDVCTTRNATPGPGHYHLERFAEKHRTYTNRGSVFPADHRISAVGPNYGVLQPSFDDHALMYPWRMDPDPPAVKPMPTFASTAPTRNELLFSQHVKNIEKDVKGKRSPTRVEENWQTLKARRAARERRVSQPPAATHGAEHPFLESQQPEQTIETSRHVGAGTATGLLQPVVADDVRSLPEASLMSSMGSIASAPPPPPRARGRLGTPYPLNKPFASANKKRMSRPASVPEHSALPPRRTAAGTPGRTRSTRAEDRDYLYSDRI